jgi:hypothetical protein
MAVALRECRAARTGGVGRRDAATEGGTLAVDVALRFVEAPAPDALAILRGYAYASGRTADDVALDLVERRLRPDRLREDAGSDR